MPQPRKLNNQPKSPPQTQPPSNSQQPPTAPSSSSSVKKQRATRGPFAIYKEEIIHTFVRDHIGEVLSAYAEQGAPSAKELTAAYNKLSGNNISVAMMKSWLKELGFKLEIRPVLINMNPTPAAPPSMSRRLATPPPAPAEEFEVAPDADEEDEEEDTGFGRPPRIAPMEPPSEAPSKPPVNIFRG